MAIKSQQVMMYGCYILSFCRLLKGCVPWSMEFFNGDLLFLGTLLKEFFQEYFSFFQKKLLNQRAIFSFIIHTWSRCSSLLLKLSVLKPSIVFSKAQLDWVKIEKIYFQSMAKKHQLFLYLHYQNQNLLSHEEQVSFFW